MAVTTTPPEPLTNPPLEITQRLVGGTYAVVHDGVFWIRSGSDVFGYPLDQWNVTQPARVVHDGDEMLRVTWVGDDDD